MAKPSRTLFSKTRQEKKRRMRYYKIGAAFIALVLLVVASVYLWNLERLRISKVEVLGASVLDEKNIEETIKEELRARYAFLYRADNALFYPKAHITQTLLLEYPRIESVQIARIELNGLSAVVEEREPEALWCTRNTATSTNETETVAIDEPCKYLDREGVAYAEAPSFSDRAYVRFYGALKDALPAPRYLTKERFGELLDLSEYLKNADLPLLSIHSSPVEGITAILDSGVELRFPLTLPANELVSSLALTRQSEALEEVPLTEIEYFDFRFGDKVYYRLRSESSTQKEEVVEQNE